MSTPLATKCGLIDKHSNIAIYPRPGLLNSFSTGELAVGVPVQVDIPDNANFVMIMKSVTATAADIGLSSRSVWIKMNGTPSVPAAATPITNGTSSIANPFEVMQLKLPEKTGNYFRVIVDQSGVELNFIFATDLYE